HPSNLLVQYGFMFLFELDLPQGPLQGREAVHLKIAQPKFSKCPVQDPDDFLRRFGVLQCKAFLNPVQIVPIRLSSGYSEMVDARSLYELVDGPKIPIWLV